MDFFYYVCMCHSSFHEYPFKESCMMAIEYTELWLILTEAERMQKKLGTGKCPQALPDSEENE